MYSEFMIQEMCNCVLADELIRGDADQLKAAFLREWDCKNSEDEIAILKKGSLYELRTAAWDAYNIHHQLQDWAVNKMAELGLGGIPCQMEMS